MGHELNEAELAAGMAPTPGYRYAEVVGDRLFTAGQVPVDGDGNLVALGDPATQARACLTNLRTVIEVNGFAASDIRHLKVYVVGEHRNLLDAWDAVVEWCANPKGLDGPVPPATLLGVNLLGYSDQLVEIDATVVGQTTPAAE